MNGPGGIITGFAYISREGRAMQPLQAGIDERSKIPFFRHATEAVHGEGCPIFLQIAHAGRQTLKSVTGMPVRGCSTGRSPYFRQKPKPLTTSEAYQVISQFADSAQYAREAGFDGVQLHAAHGYLLHQFLLPATNDRKDEFGIDNATGVGHAFLEQVIMAVREKCGNDFAILVKVSGGVDIKPPFGMDQFMGLIRFLNRMPLDAIEISYGTMDHALNIFRGDVPEALILSHNPILKSNGRIRKSVTKYIIRHYFIPRLKGYTSAYNLEYAAMAKKLTGIPVISVGGFRNGDEIYSAVNEGKADIIGLSRALVCEPDFISKLKSNKSYESHCTNCNKCSVMCDSFNETKCYTIKTKHYGTDQQDSFHHQPEC
jgi:2,4-dienoyl-CoA reductase-like NADH-dependent reductase (Old Yellow Enzyme family)